MLDVLFNKKTRKNSAIVAICRWLNGVLNVFNVVLPFLYQHIIATIVVLYPCIQTIFAETNAITFWVNYLKLTRSHVNNHSDPMGIINVQLCNCSYEYWFYLSNDAHYV